jgi:ankyrin repeat protein
MEGCCICLDECITLIINSGCSICNACMRRLNRRCPLTRMEITIKLPNNFAGDFYQYPLPPPDFDMKDLLDSLDKIAYMNQFDKIEINNPDLLIKDGRCVLNLDEFKIFTKKCINLDCPGISGRHLIHRMCWINNLDIVKCLVTNGADVNCVDNWGWHPIHEACRNGDGALELVKFLVANGADVNCADIWGNRPIHLACDQGDKALELVKFLMESGADVNCTNLYGRNPINDARDYESLKLVEILKAWRP